MAPAEAATKPPGRADEVDIGLVLPGRHVGRHQPGDLAEHFQHKAFRVLPLLQLHPRANPRLDLGRQGQVTERNGCRLAPGLLLRPFDLAEKRRSQRRPLGSVPVEASL